MSRKLLRDMPGGGTKATEELLPRSGAFHAQSGYAHNKRFRLLRVVCLVFVFVRVCTINVERNDRSSKWSEIVDYVCLIWFGFAK